MTCVLEVGYRKISLWAACRIFTQSGSLIPSKGMKGDNGWDDNLVLLSKPLLDRQRKSVLPTNAQFVRVKLTMNAVGREYKIVSGLCRL